MAGRERQPDLVKQVRDLQEQVRRLWQRMGYMRSPAGASLPSFALSGNGFTTPSTPVILDNANLGHPPMNFSTVASDTFDMSSGGRARILRTGFYVIGCQLNVRTTVSGVANDTYVYLSLRYRASTGSSDSGYSIEIPYFQSGFTGTGLLGEEVIGTRYVYPMGDNPGHDIALQRLHPISLLTSTFPVEIRPEFLTNYESNVQVGGLGLWGFRVGDDLGGYFSD